ncbi:HNH endonuclease signature motif containing protein [Frankia sp. AvcI1]|uniref:HNH endonuclease signature motif containing protein n=1 Tax=Frankia sp. AvcI1 TaxID=573496 RepID=UPI0021189E0C|nr:HNH endonuclease signature motif containing protein [Frankia sp. AvcI1]
MSFEDGARDGPVPPARLAVIAGQVEGLLSDETWRLSDGELEALIEGVCRLVGRVAAARGRLLVEAQDRGFALRQGAVDTAAWLRDRLALASREARRQITLARDVHEVCRATGAALAAGELTVEHAVVICEAMRSLPAGVTPEQRGEAELALLAFAHTFDPYQLVKLAARQREALTMVDTSPGGDDPHADSQTGEHNNPGSGRTGNAGAGNAGGDGDSADTNNRERPSPDPADIRRLTLTDTPAGTTLLSGELDAEGAAMLRTALDSLAAPHPAVDGTSDSRSPARRRADALIDLISRALGAAALPESGGVRPHLTVTIPWKTLLAADTIPATTSWGLPLPRAALARLSCDAEISRILLDPAGVPLDVGRSTRTVPAHLRRALAIRDQGCVFPGCDRPPSWCEAHHAIHWRDGGPTALHNLLLLCATHHRRVHHDGWDIIFTDDHRPALIPPHRIDPLRRPRRNPYSQPPPHLRNTA